MQATNCEELLKLDHLQVNYGSTPIVRDASISLKQGEIFGIVGESGSGKSTLLNAVLQNFQGGANISDGKILFRGEELAGKKRSEMRKIRGSKIGMVFQNPWDSLNPSRKIKTQFYEALRAHRRISRGESKRLAIGMMGRLNLENSEELLEMYPFQLSGGMNQRVSLALAMIMEPELLLADEPTSALDVTVQAQVIDEMMQLRDNFGTSILIVTHNMGLVAHMVDRVAVMYNGRIVEYGQKNHILQHPVHPYTRALMKATPDFSGRLPGGISGTPPAFGAAVEGCAFAPRCNRACELCREEQPQYQEIHEGHFCACVLGRDCGSNEEKCARIPIN